MNNQTPYHLSIKNILDNGRVIDGAILIYPFKNDYIIKKKINNGDSIVVQSIKCYGAIIEKKTK
ncbi:hypothetical protein [Providencia hangzhouensis]|uniref:hypothetical protein n=1 Tax=Providencia hangzhouensis TaxID=3031799 RepID=UPI0034DD54BA